MKVKLKMYSVKLMSFTHEKIQFSSKRKTKMEDTAKICK